MEVPECFRQEIGMIKFGSNEAFPDWREWKRAGAEKCERVEVSGVGRPMRPAGGVMVMD